MGFMPVCLHSRSGNDMGDDTDRKPDRFRPDADNSGPSGEPDTEVMVLRTWRRIDGVVLASM
jgi:hypothetical protein